MTIKNLIRWAALAVAASAGLAEERLWNGAGANAFASNPTNWVGETAPTTNDAIVLDGSTHKSMTWDLNVPIQSWTQVGYSGTVTVQTIYGTNGFTNLTILGDCVISNGVWTQTANPVVNYETNRLRVTIGGNLTVGADAAIDVTAKGYTVGRGPGTAGGGQNVAGASHGGRGQVYSGKNPGLCYGSIASPTNLGSGGGYSAGGGAILFAVNGTVWNDGLFRADGGKSDHYEGAGGSIYIVAGALAGAGHFRADGGEFTGYASPAGGGRVALVVTNSGSDFSAFTGTVTAFGSQKAGAEGGCAGTVYFETPAHAPGKGELRVDNFGGWRPYASLGTDLNGIEAVTYEFSRITLTNGAQLHIGSDDTLIVTNTVLVGAGGLSNGIWMTGGTLVAPANFAYSNLFIGIASSDSVLQPTASLTIGTNAELRVDQPYGMTGDIVIAGGGVLTHTANPASMEEVYRCELTLDGSLLVRSGGSVDVTGKGFPPYYGPGTHPSVNSGASYGGLGLSGLSCYGSLVTPVNLGSGGRYSGAAGGGAIRLMVSGMVSNDGAIRANAAEIAYRTGSGGSVFITAGVLAGEGLIQANSANNVSGDSPGGGGRIALVVTNAGANFSNYPTNRITAYGGRKTTTSGGAGTVYLRAAGEGLHDGTLIVDNDNLTGLGTEISSNVTDTTVANVIIQRKGNLQLATNRTLTVSGIWSNAASLTAHAGSAIVFAGGVGSTSMLFGSTTFGGLFCTNAGKTLRFEAGSTNSLAADCRLQVAGEGGNRVIWRSTENDTPWKLNVHPLAEQVIDHLDVRGCDASGGAEVTAINSADSGLNTHWRFIDVEAGETNTWTGAGNTLWSARENWSLDRSPLPDDWIVIPGGCPRYPVLDNIDRTMAGLTVAAGGQLSLNGYNLTVHDTAVLAGSLIGSGTEIVTFRKKLTFSGALTAAGTERLVLEGDSDFSGATIDPAFSTVVLAGGAAQAINMGGVTFYKVCVDNRDGPVTLSGGLAATELRCEASSGTRSLVFEDGKTVALRDLVLRGAVGATNITLTSTTPGAKWNLAVTGYRSVRGVDAHDSDARSGLPIPALASEDGGGNENWQFDAVPSVWLGTSGNNFHTAANWNPAAVPDGGTRVLVEGANPMTITGTVSILDLTVGGGTVAPTVTVNGAVTVGENVVVLDKGTLVWNQPGVMSNDLIVAMGGLLTHSPNTSTEAHKVTLTVGGDVVVDVAGAVDVTAKGYAANTGPGKPPTGSQGGASYGGVGSLTAGTVYGPCYGSIVAPTNLGSGGGVNQPTAGGGAIRMDVAGTLRLDGRMLAEGEFIPTSNRPGSGGSIFLTAGYLRGAGMMSANGSSQYAAGGGGRIALVVTNAGADFSAYTGTCTAWGGYGYYSGHGGAGTVYRQTASDKPGRGVVSVENNNSTQIRYTPLPAGFPGNVPGEADRAVFRIRDGARLRLTNDFMVGDIWLETANAMLDLGTNTLTVNARRHDLTPGSVTNAGAIVWMGLAPGSLIMVK